MTKSKHTQAAAPTWPQPVHTETVARCDVFDNYTVLRVPKKVQGPARSTTATEKTMVVVIEAHHQDEQAVYDGPSFEAVERVLMDTRRGILYLCTVQTFPGDQRQVAYLLAYAFRYYRKMVLLDSSPVDEPFSDWFLDEITGRLQLQTARGIRPVERFATLETGPDPDEPLFDWDSHWGTQPSVTFLGFVLNRLLRRYGEWQSRRARQERFDGFGRRILPGENYFTLSGMGWGYAYVLSGHSARELCDLVISPDHKAQLGRAFATREPLEVSSLLDESAESADEPA